MKKCMSKTFFPFCMASMIFFENTNKSEGPRNSRMYADLVQIQIYELLDTLGSFVNFQCHLTQAVQYLSSKLTFKWSSKNNNLLIF